MASTSPANPDLPRQSSSLHLLAELQSDQSKNFGSMNMDEFLKNIYSDSDAFPADHVAAAGKRTVDEVWKEIVSGTVGSSSEPHMTLEDFLTKAGAVREEDVRLPGGAGPQGFPVDSMMNGAVMPFQAPAQGFDVESAVGFGNGIDGRIVAVGGSGGGGRGKRRAVEEAPVDKATQQKQRRMIKNRESAARSRERKQAYTVELESLVTQLEEENARLLREEAEQTKERFKQLMENLIPVVEKKRPPRVLRRVNSM